MAVITSFNANLMVADMSRSITFYCTYLGSTVVQATPAAAPDWAMLKAGEVVLMLQAASQLRAEYPVLATCPPGGALTFYLHVADVHAAYAALAGHAPVAKALHRTDYGAWEFAILDPDGFVLTLAQDE